MPSPIGHGLAGLTAAWAIDLIPGNRAWRTAPPLASWFDRAGGDLTLFCALLAIAPDLDLLVGGHRTITHSVGGAIFVGLFAAALAANARRPVVRVALMSAAAFATHILMDWLGADSAPPFGIQALWPFSDHWYISGWKLFLKTERRQFFSVPTILQNTVAVAEEVAILGPIAMAVWLVRVKALAGLPAEMSRGHHAAEQRARPVLRIAQPVVQHVEDREAHVEPDEVGKR
jgi:membrane-bound metal-dependent hydrolase YbcI (DUF457 family)